MSGTYHEAQKETPRVVCGVEEEREKNMGKKRYSVQIIEESIQAILSYGYVMVKA